MSIRDRLFAIVALFLIPIVLLGYLFIAQSRKDISFAQLERRGVEYLAAVWPGYMQLVTAPAGRSSPPAADLSFRQARERLDADLKTGESSLAFEKARAAAASAIAAKSRNESVVAAIAAARTLIAKIGDGSNLILDPDLDSFYVMDLIVNKAPEAVDALAKVTALSRTAHDAASMTNRDTAAILSAIGQLEGTVAAIESAFASAYQGNADGAVRRALDSHRLAFAEAARATVAELGRVSDALLDESRRKTSDLSALAAAEAKMMGAADALWKASAGELDRLLDKRIDGFLGNLYTMLGLSIAVTLAALGLAMFVARSIIRAIGALDKRIRDLADERLDAEIEGLNARNEIGQIARAVAYFRDAVVESLASANSEERKREMMVAQRRALAGVADRVRLSVGGTTRTLHELAQSIERSVATVAVNSDQTRERLGEAIRELNNASSNVGSVVTGVHELAASIDEISEQTTLSARDSEAAKEKATAAKQVADRLAEASARIGDILKLISDIAAQTNLLALNATIEAARAGEAGRGFAVVAQEVKTLAGQTANATEGIEKQVAEIREAAAAVLASVDQITGATASISLTSTAIAGAVEEQNQSTKKINENLRMATEGTDFAVQAINAIPQAANETADAANALVELAKTLIARADQLDSEVGGLLGELTADSPRAAA